MQNTFESQFKVGDEVTFEVNSIINEYYGRSLYGTVVAVLFTKSKVFYYIVDDLDARIYEKIPSENVKLAAQS
jgi:hypothetical protein